MILERAIDGRREPVPGGGRLLHRNRLWLGAAIYLTAACVDTHMTLAGLGGNLAMEGNPLLRSTMAWLGPAAGLLAHKLAFGSMMLVIGLLGERALSGRRQTQRGVVRLPWLQAWPDDDCSWAAYLPLYLCAAGQAVAALSWSLLAVVLPV